VKAILNNMKYELEVIAFDIESCLIAAENGADRIELCANPFEGGTTPSLGMIRQARKSTGIQLFPIIRPRGGDFLYSKAEFDAMKCDITACLDEGCEGVVIGMLKKDGTVDVDNCRELVVAAGKMEVTFHRAFDRVLDPENSLEEIIAMGCKRILTSGLKPTAPEGSELLMKLVQQAANRITIMPGSGIRAGNIRALALATGAKAFHSSARLSKGSDMDYKNMEMNELLNKITLDGTEVSALRNELNTIASL
jgi:copper homeostasis protein